MKCKMVFMLLWGMLLSSLSMGAQQVTNKLYIPEVECGRGKTINVAVALNNDSEIVALQFKLRRPDYSTLVRDSWELTDRKSDHVLSVSGSGKEYLFVIYSPTNSPLRGNSGNIINFSMKVPESWEVGSRYPFTMTEPILSIRNGDNVLTSSDPGALLVIEDPRPDVAVSAVKVDKTSYTPGDKISVSWLVINEGDKETGDGWSEQVSLVADNGEEVYLGKVYYESVLGIGGSVSRQAEFALSEPLGIEGSVKAKVKLIPGANLGELAAAIGNNTAQSETVCDITKKLRVELPSAAIEENNTSLIRCKLYRSGSWANEQVFSLRADKPERLNVPESVTIPAGQSGGTFYIRAIDNEVLDVDSIVTITIAGNGYEAITGEVGILDNELPTLTLTTSKTELTEGESFTLTVERELVKDTPLTVYLTCDHQSRFSFLNQIVIPAGEKSVSVSVKAIDDDLPDVTISAEFVVTAARHINSKCLVLLNDNDLPELSLTITPETVSEAAGPLAVMAVLRRLSHTDNTITVKLSDNSDGRIYYSSSTLTLASGVTEAAFTIGVVDNSLVEEEQVIDITAAIYLSSCNCSATGTTGGAVHATLKLLDDDGPTLKISSSQAMLPEGKEHAAVLTVTRNTSTEQALTIKLSSDHDEELIYESSVTIPAGQRSVDIPVSVKANEVTEGNRTVSFTVAADGFTQGTCWVMVTDQTLPDAVVSMSDLSVSEIEMGEKIDISVEVMNTGVVPLPYPLIVNLYLDNASTLLGSFRTTKKIAVGESEVLSTTVTLPEIIGEHVIYAVANEDHLITELLSLNNTSEKKTIKLLPRYTVSAAVDKQLYNQGESVLITGTVSGKQVANVPVEVYLINSNIRQTLSAVTDEKGKYQVTFKPYALQSGHFIVGACYPGEKLSIEQTTFDIYGLKRVSSNYLKCEITEGETFDGEVSITNPGVLTLNNLTVDVLSAPENCTVSFSKQDRICGDETVSLAYRIIGNKPSEGSQWEKIKARVSSVEGVTLDFDIYYFCRSLKGQLEADISSIKTTMTKGTSRDYSFTIANRGKGETGAIVLALPPVDWIKAVTPLEMPSLKYGESTTVILRLTPTEDLPLNRPLTGQIAVNCANGNGISMNYSCTPVSESTGKLVVDVCDEYTYYTSEAPHLAGAKVAIMNSATDALVMQGTTDENGLYIVESLPEGYYKLMVSADKHDVYTNNILVDPGKENRKTINLSFQAITIDWQVEETTVNDEYEIVTTVKYETNVPVPVVEVIMPDSLPVQELIDKGIYMFNAVLTNKGLITAQDVHIDIPESDVWTCELLVKEDFNLLPSESVVVPVRVRLKDDVESAPQRSVNRMKIAIKDFPCHMKTYTIVYWDCGNDRKWHQYEKFIKLPHCNVPSYPSTSSGGGDGGGWGWIGAPGGLGGSGGGSTYVPSSNNDPAPSIVDKGCEPCQNGMIIAGVKCVSHFVPVTEAVNKIVESYELIDSFLPDEGEDFEFDIDLDAAVRDEMINKMKEALAKFDWAKLLMKAHEQASECISGIKSDDKDVVEKVLGCSKAMEDFLDAALEDEFKRLLPEPYRKHMKKMLKVTKKLTSFITKLVPVIKCVDDFIHACDHLDHPANRAMATTKSSIPSYIEDFQGKMILAQGVYEAMNTIHSEIFGDIDAWNDITMEEYDKLFSHLNGVATADELIGYKPDCVTEEQFRSFVDRWNNTLSEDATSENVISIQKIIDTNNIIYNATAKAKKWGYVSMTDCVEQEVKNVMDRAEGGSGSVCSTITLQFSQTMTMTRQAFRGTLTVFNGHQTTAMTGVKLNLEVKNSDGGLVTSHEFQINNENLDNFKGELEGNWTLEAQQTGKATILFIPTKYAAPTDAESYSFGGTLSYIDPFTGLEVTRNLFPVTMTVKPSPNLELTYFMQRDILGDDPLTKDIVEPMVPAEFSLLIRNVGAGDGTNINMVTNQPEVVANEKGLLIDFNLIGQQLNGGDFGSVALGKSAVTKFGDISAGKTAYAQWWFTSSLLGHFTEYDVQATHVTSYGNPDLSLLDTVSIHELIRSIKIPQDNHSFLTGFLTNDIADAEDLPDMLYLSDGTVENVSIVSDVQCAKKENNQYILTVLSGNTGWNYGVISDPTNGRQNLISVTRLGDNTAIELRNFWQTDRTLRDGKDPLYENRIHFVDRLVGVSEQYLLTFEERPEVTLEVESFIGIPEAGTYVSKPLTDVKVRFNKPVIASTFTTDDMTLTCQGRMIENMDAVTITKINDREFALGLSAVTLKDGYYVLTVQTAEITDTENYCGQTGKNAGWVQYMDGTIPLTIKVQPENAGTTSLLSGRYDYNSVLNVSATPKEGYRFVNWSMAGEELSTEPEYEFTLSTEGVLVANFKLKSYNLILNYDQNGGMVVGSGTGVYDHGTILNLTATPVLGYTFDGWKISGSPCSTEETLQITVLEDLNIEAVFTKIPNAVTVSYEFPTGWNWFSINVKDENLNNPVALLEPIKQSVVSVLGQEEDLVYDDQYGLYGSLTAFKPDRGYKVRVKEDVDFSLKGIPFAENEVTITLNKGWNWMGYTPNMEMSVNAALCNLMAEEGDIVMAQDQFATYDGAAWKGSLSVLAPGNAYLYYSGSVKSFNYPTGSSKMAIPMLSYRASESYYFAKWQYDKRKYADNMGVISRLYSSSGQELPAGQFLIGAFTGEECRGMSSEADGYQFVTVHGEQTNEKVTFRAYNTLTGEEFDIKETICFSANVVGNLTNPFILHLGSATGLDKNGSSLLIYPNPVKDRLFIRTDLQNVKEIRIIDMKGSVLLTTDTLPLGVGLDVTSLTEGIYFITIQTDTDLIRQKFVKSNRAK